MGIVNIENESMNKISPVKKDSASHQLSSKIIEEVSEENHSQSATSIKKESKVRFSDLEAPANQKNNAAAAGRPPLNKIMKTADSEPKGQGQQNPLMKIYQRIDQEQLEKHGLGHKSELESDSQVLGAAHQFSMLQRFREGRSFQAVDRYKPKNIEKEEQQAIRDRENQWIRENTVTDEQRELEKKSKIEKARYITALKALVKEKGAKMSPDSGNIPALCSCGAQIENIKQLKRSASQGGLAQGDEAIHMCASNCQFYNNEKGYVRALRDVLHSISLFK